MEQLKQKMDKFYRKPDPWGCKTSEDDIKRKNIILKYVKKARDKNRGFFNRALDIGAGEGFITRFLPAHKIYGYELSDQAASRFPSNVERVLDLDGGYDLMLATEVLYKQYNVGKLLDLIMIHANGFVVTCNIKDQEINNLPFLIEEYEFPYRQYVERLRIHDFRIT